MQPNNSSAVTALGSTISKIVSAPPKVKALANYFHTVVFPEPGLPIMKQE
jgi:hypothetical protein